MSPGQSAGAHWRFYRHLGVAWGVLAFYALLITVFTSWPRKRGGRKLWHAVHLISVPATLIACVHAYQLGSDRSTAVFRVLALVAVAGTLYTSTLRLSGIAKSRTA